MRAGEVVVVSAGPTRRRLAATDARRELLTPPLRRAPRPTRALALGLATILSLETATARAAAHDLAPETSPARAAHDLAPEPSPARAALDPSHATLTGQRHPPVPLDLPRPRSTPPAPDAARVGDFSTTTFAAAADLSFGPPAPSPRDLAYEQGQAAKEAGDDVRAAEEFARAYRLTPADETGPRLMLLRESVDARLRAHQRGAGAREQLCPARGLLREHLAGDAAGALTDERTRLARVEQGLGAVDCDAPEPPAPQDPAPAPPVPADTSPGSPRPVPPSSSPGSPRPVPPSSSPTDAPAAAAPLAGPQQPVPEDMSSAPRRSTSRGRALRIAGAAALGVGAAALVPMGVGIALARDATRDGRRVCWGMDIACDGGSDLDVQDILKRGYDADTLVRISAPIAGVALLTGLVLLSVGLAVRGRTPVAVAPRLGPGSLGVGLQGRF